MSLKSKLNLMKGNIIRGTDKPSDFPEANVEQRKIDIHFSEKWEAAGVKPYILEDDYCFIREKRFPIDYRHGHYSFLDLYTAINAWEESTSNHPLSAKGLKASNLFFFDTETTGLSGGAGNSIFLLGHAQVRENEVILKQHFLPEPGFEVPFYKSFLESVDYTTLVTYNGKAFDWPQVKTQHRLVRDHVPKLPAYGHFDLYHAARRLWKDRMDSVKLVNVEREILGVHRTDDIPGYLAPMIYFDYVDRKDPEAVLQVLKHNELDILSLITLYIHLTFQIHGLDPHQTAKDKVIIGKWFDYIGERDAASTIFETAAGEGDIVARHELAFSLKRKKQYKEAYEEWAQVADIGDSIIQRDANIELAKLMEHQFKDYYAAIQRTQKAKEIHLQLDDIDSKNRDSFIMEVNKRLQRLYGKYDKNS
ncbi:ribonuclease H-like domain-containing protein [Lederbergia graminis]|uniref:Ribonuclease H-like domain-containing protein n=2 Tax=Lederbergia graminis TaxID=735518 RepID=A0ABW0LC08_9BACI